MVQSLPLPAERALGRLSQLLKTLRETPQAEAMIEALIPYLRREMGYSFAWFGLAPAGENYLIGYEAFSPLERRLMHRERLALDSGGLLEEVFIERRPLSLPDLGAANNAGKWQTVARTIGIQGSLLFPIHCHDRCYGIAILGRQTWGMSPKPSEIAALSMLLGQMATTLYQHQTSELLARKKQPAAPLLRLLDELRHLPSLDLRLKRLVDETHQFVGASRTSLYWFEPVNRYFERRFVNHAHSNDAGKGQAPQLAVEDCPSLYQTLSRDRPLSLSDTGSSLQAEISSYLQSQLKVRSLLAAPICTEERLLGFFATEGFAPRLWTEEEKQYLQGIAQLAALVAPLGNIEAAIAQGKADQDLVAHLGQTVRSEQSWQEGLRRTAEQLFERLGIERLLLLDYDEAQQHFPLLLQHQLGKRKPLGEALPPLGELDLQLLREQGEALVIEDWRNDLRLLAWKKPLEQLGVQSVLVCSTAAQRYQEGLLIVTRDQPYGWSWAEQSLVRTIAQQLYLVMHQRALERQVSRLDGLHRSLQWGLATLHQEQHPDRLDWVGTQAIAQLLDAPLVGLITWSPTDGSGTLVASWTSDSAWTLPAGLSLDGLSDPLMQRLLQSDGPLLVDPDAIPEESRSWLTLPRLDQVLLFHLRSSPTQVPQGVVLVGLDKRRRWPSEVLDLASLLVSQLSHSRQLLRRLTQLQGQQQQLQQLNWYKQYCGERFQSSLQRDLKRLQEAHRTEPAFQRMESLLEMMADVLGREHWALETRLQTLTLTSFLKQAKERIDGQVSQQQLWCQFHCNDVQQAQLRGDILKLEGIVHSMLVAACDRCLIGGRIDVWCRLQPDNRVEITVTDNGIMDPQLLNALQPTADLSDPLFQALLEEGPGLLLSLVQRLTERLGGTLDFVPLEDGRTMSRLLIHR